MNRLTGVVESITCVESISTGLDFMKVRIDFDELYMFGSYVEAIKFLSKSVEYSTRMDMYKGQPYAVIVNMVDTYTVQTVDKTDNIKLIPVCEGDRAICNFDITDLLYTDSQSNCVGFLAGYEKRTSDKSEWLELRVIDKRSHAFIMKLFTRDVVVPTHESPEDVVRKLVGRYIEFGVRYSKYGYSAINNEVSLHNVPVLLSPEVDIAITQIQKAVAGDSELQSYMNTYDYINKLKQIIDYEMGYQLVNVAAEIYMINAVTDISSEYDKKLMVRAAICSRGYLLGSNNKFSRTMLNTNKVMRSELKTDTDLMFILDPFAEEPASKTKTAYYDIGRMVRKILEDRRTVNVDNALPEYVNKCRREICDLI